MKSHFRLAFLCMVMLASLFAGNGYQKSVMAQASADTQHQSEQPKCWALDVMMILDMSFSMDYNDPEGYRFGAVTEVIDELVQNRLEECPEVVHRVGLVTFSDEGEDYTKIQMNLTNIEIPLGETDPLAWADSKFERLINNAREAEQGNTNFEAAFAKAKEAFLERSPAPGDPVGYGPRRQLVVLVTDGYPTRSLNPTNSVGIDELMCSWIETIQGESFWANKSIWILPLLANTDYLSSEGCDGKTIRTNFEDLVTSKGKGRLSEYTYSKQTIPLFVSELLENEFGRTTERIKCNDIFLVDPYSQYVRFTFTAEKRDDPLRVTITKLDDKTGNPIYRLQNGEIIESIADPRLEAMTVTYAPSRSFKEEYKIFNPMPGKWFYSVEGMSGSECQGYVDGYKAEVVAEVFFQSDVLPQVAESPFYDPAFQKPFILKLKVDETIAKSGNAKSDVVLNDDNYPLDIDVSWVLPSSATNLPNGQPLPTIKLMYSESDQGWVNTLDSPLLTPEEGIYKLEIVGTAKKASGAGEFEVFRYNTTVQVVALKRFAFAMQTPKPDDILSCNAIQDGKSIPNPIPVAIQLQNDAGANAQASDYLTDDYSKAFVAELLDENRKLIDSISLKPEKDGEFQGILLEDQDKIIGCGKVTIRVRFAGEYRESEFALPQKEIEWQTERVESKGLKVTVSSPINPTERFTGMMSACVAPQYKPIEIRFNLQDLSDNQVNVADVLVDNQKPFYQVRLKAPESQEWKELLVQPGNLPNELVATANGETVDITQAGTYLYEITPISGAFARGYVSSQPKVSGSFERKDTPWNNPVACGVSWGFSGTFLAAIAGALGYLFTGGPGGLLEFVDDNGDPLMAKKLGNTRLSTFRTYKTSPGLHDKEVKKIRYKSVRSSDENGKAIQLYYFRGDVNVPMEETIEAVSPDNKYAQTLTSDVSVRYTHPKAKGLS